MRRASFAHLGTGFKRLFGERRTARLLGIGLLSFLCAILLRVPAAWTLHEVDERLGIAITCGDIHGTLWSGTCADARFATNGASRLRVARLSWRVAFDGAPGFIVDLNDAQAEGIPGDFAFGDYRLWLDPAVDGALTGALESATSNPFVLRTAFTFDRATRSLRLKGQGELHRDAPEPLRRALAPFGVSADRPTEIDLVLGL